MIEPETLEKINKAATSMILCSRNKLIEQLLTQLPLSERVYQQGFQLLRDNWEHDKVLWSEAQEKVLKEGR